MQKSFNWYLMKLDRVSAWTLLGTMVLYFISGYGMTKGIISGSLAINIHNNWLPLVLLASFCFHTCYAISLAFKRWRIWSPTLGAFLVILYLIFFGCFVYINSFYQKTAQNKIQSQTSSSSQGTAQIQSSSSQSSGTNTQKVFTKAELAKYNGQGGQAAYVAVSGTVYDVSSIFVGGNHRGWSAGQDITTEFYQVHNDSFLSGLTVVGTYSG